MEKKINLDIGINAVITNTLTYGSFCLFLKSVFSGVYEIYYVEIDILGQLNGKYFMVRNLEI